MQLFSIFSKKYYADKQTRNFPMPKYYVNASKYLTKIGSNESENDNGDDHLLIIAVTLPT